MKIRGFSSFQKIFRLWMLGLPRKDAMSEPVLSQTKNFEIVNKMYTL